MAPPPSPPRRTALLLLLFLALLLLSVVAYGGAARDHHLVAAAATSRGHAEAELQGQRRRQVAADANPCGAGDGEEGEAADQDDEECLMRRTLEAHTDYIYTQSGGHS